MIFRTILLKFYSEILLTGKSSKREMHKKYTFPLSFLEECIKIKVIVQKTGGGTIDFWMKYGDKES